MKKYLIFLALAISYLAQPQTMYADSTVYIFDNWAYMPLDYLTFNADTIQLVERPIQKHGTLDKYKKALTKYTIKNDGRLTIAREFHWYGKPYHDEITLDLNDGDVYYLQMVSGMHSTIKLLKPKDGEKDIEKAKKKPDEWIICPDVTYEN